MPKQLSKHTLSDAEPEEIVGGNSVLIGLIFFSGKNIN